MLTCKKIPHNDLGVIHQMDLSNYPKEFGVCEYEYCITQFHDAHTIHFIHQMDLSIRAIFFTVLACNRREIKKLVTKDTH